MAPPPKKPYDENTKRFGSKTERVNFRITKKELDYIKSAVTHGFAPGFELTTFFVEMAKIAAADFLKGPSYEEQKAGKDATRVALGEMHGDAMEFERKKQALSRQEREKLFLPENPNDESISFSTAKREGRLGPDNTLLPTKPYISHDPALRQKIDALNLPGISAPRTPLSFLDSLPTPAPVPAPTQPLDFLIFSNVPTAVPHAAGPKAPVQMILPQEVTSEMLAAQAEADNKARGLKKMERQAAARVWTAPQLIDEPIEDDGYDPHAPMGTPDEDRKRKIDPVRQEEHRRLMELYSSILTTEDIEEMKLQEEARKEAIQRTHDASLAMDAARRKR